MLNDVKASDAPDAPVLVSDELFVDVRCPNTNRLIFRICKQTGSIYWQYRRGKPVVIDVEFVRGFYATFE